MNYSIIIYIIGMILEIEAVFMTLPAITALIYQETSGVAFLITIALCLVIGLPLTRKKPTRKAFYTKEGFVTVALSWIVLSIIGAIPFVISRSIPNPVDALFETVSGFTTTGASILSDVEALPHCMLMWRSFTHWIGGMGVLVFILSLLPLTGGYHMNLMKAESPGPSVSKLAPKVQSTAKILYSIYFVMTVIQILLLLVGGMPLFDSICTAFGTAGTGGFGIKNDSMASYSTYLQVVITVWKKCGIISESSVLQFLSSPAIFTIFSEVQPKLFSRQLSRLVPLSQQPDMQQQILIPGRKFRGQSWYC